MISPRSPTQCLLPGALRTPSPARRGGHLVLAEIRLLDRFPGGCPYSGDPASSLLFGHVTGQGSLATECGDDLLVITVLVSRLGAPLEFGGHPGQQRRAFRRIARRSAATQQIPYAFTARLSPNAVLPAHPPTSFARDHPPRQEVPHAAGTGSAGARRATTPKGRFRLARALRRCIARACHPSGGISIAGFRCTAENPHPQRCPPAIRAGKGDPFFGISAGQRGCLH